MRWAIQIERTTLDRRHLFDLIDNLGYKPADVPGHEIVLWSATLEVCESAGEVWEEAKRLRELISEVTEIDPEFVLGPVLDLSSGAPKRQFFLEGADIYDFGISLGHSLMPFYSRRIGLYEGKEVPILWGGKINGKVKNTHFGSLITQTSEVNSLVQGSKMGVVRIKQNILKESSFGMIATMGDPGARSQA